MTSFMKDREKLENELREVIEKFQHKNKLLIEKIHINIGSVDDAVDIRVQIIKPTI